MTSIHRYAAVGLLALGISACQTVSPVVKAQEPVSVFAAGSLREALTAIAGEYEKNTGQRIELSFAASGLLRERIEKGEAAQVFASADTEHPQRLASTGQWQSPTVFVRNALCAITSDKISATPATLLATMLQADVRLGTSTPKADPAGDYAWLLFHRAEALQQGAFAQLDAKALKLTGGADSPQPPKGKGAYAWVMEQGQADIFLTYCTNAMAAQREVPRLRVVQLPAQLQVGAAYGLTVRTNAPASAQTFARSLGEPYAQTLFKRLGFAAP
jgi:molybdenum ABC transporter molybdate-binding protein